MPPSAALAVVPSCSPLSPWMGTPSLNPTEFSEPLIYDREAIR
ncbi:hypothetical protein [Solidesulfovibrio sp.]